MIELEAIGHTSIWCSVIVWGPRAPARRLISISDAWVELGKSPPLACPRDGAIEINRITRRALGYG